MPSAPEFTLTAPDAEPLAYKWCPSAECDEAGPDLTPSPNGWILPNDAGIQTLGAYDWDDCKIIPGTPLSDGQIVQFSGFHDFGWCELKTQADGSVIADPPIDPRATHLSDGPSLYNTIEEAAADDCEEILAGLWITQQFRFDAASGQFMPAGPEKPLC